MGLTESRERTLRQRFVLWSNRLRLDIRLRKRSWYAQIVLHERFKPWVLALKIALTVIGLIFSLVSFQSIFVAFLFSLSIYLVGTILEKSAFSYNSLYVHSMPHFEIQPEKWLGAFFGHIVDPANPHQIPLVGWIISDPEYAKKVHSLLLRWSYGQLQDKANNIRTSVIVESKSEYIFFCYPDIRRKTAMEFYQEIEMERKKKSLEDVHDPLIMMLVFGKRCRITANSHFPTFRERYRDGVPYLFRLAVQGDDGQLHAIRGLADFVLFNLKIKERGSLDRRDLEYDLLRVMG